MTIGKALAWITIIVAAGVAVIFGTLTDVSARIRERYPSATVLLHEGHSPGVHPLLSLMRLFRDRHFLSSSDWVDVGLTDEVQPVDLAVLLQFRVHAIRVVRCKVTNLSPLGSRRYPTYAEFSDCDLSALPVEQKGILRASAQNPQSLTYGGP
jgi:hypothetical protein